MQKIWKRVAKWTAAAVAFSGFAASAYADVTGYACRVQRIPTANTSIHGDFGYIRLYVHSTPDCTGTALDYLVFLTNNPSISGATTSWVYSEQEVLGLYNVLSHAAIGGKKVRFVSGVTILGGGIYGNYKQGYYAEIAYP